MRWTPGWRWPAFLKNRRAGKRGATDEYSQRLAAEAAYWGDFTVRWIDRGIVPPWGDTRLAISQLIANGHQDRILGAELENLSRRRQHLRRLIMRVRELASEGRQDVLDLGCGSGFLSLEMARQGARVTGIDCSAGQLAIAGYFGEAPERWRAHLFPRYLCLDTQPQDWVPPRYERRDFNAWIPEAGSLDIVVAHDALHHAPDLEKTAGLIAGALKPGGEALILDHQDMGEGLVATRSRLIERLAGLVSASDDPLDLPELECYARIADFPPELGQAIMSGLSQRLREVGIDTAETAAPLPDEVPPEFPEEESAFEGADERNLGSRLRAALEAHGLTTVLYEESLDPWDPEVQKACPENLDWVAFYRRRAVAERAVFEEDGLSGDGCLLWLRKPDSES